MPDDRNAEKTPLLLVLFAWLVVSVPAVWGVSQTVTKSMDLFRPPVATPTTSAGVR